MSEVIRRSWEEFFGFDQAAMEEQLRCGSALAIEQAREGAWAREREGDLQRRCDELKACCDRQQQQIEDYCRRIAELEATVSAIGKEVAEMRASASDTP